MNCQMKVTDFCLTDASPINSTMWEFLFTINVDSNANCGGLHAWIDVMWEGYKYLGGMSLPTSVFTNIMECGTDT